MSDPVHAPSHYQRGGVDCMDTIRALLTHEEFVGFCYGNLIKYTFRWPSKGQTPTERMQDLAKAEEYARLTREAYDELDTLSRKRVAEMVGDPQ